MKGTMARDGAHGPRQWVIKHCSPPTRAKTACDCHHGSWCYSW
ncbi:hypothetical protein MTR67_034549 [Solanum verrucosum]|uniref:Uncharacterized protein n=1 Tax=Solanum verrucosum TaxID=315347 RepID=A0AAF0ZLE4_SOLVR|nr:hypothetical protein MTR67_034549 [Solanum verrucosum]